MDSSIVGFLVVSAVLVGSAIFLVVKKQMDSSEVEKGERARGSTAIACPHCAQNLQSDMDKVTGNRATGKKFIKLKCHCGATSTWDMHGNPPVMSAYTKPAATNSAQSTDKKSS